jgi:hypothetical protein
MPATQIIKLNNENYFDWAELMEALLVKQDLWVTVVGPQPAGLTAVLQALAPL